MPSCVRDHTRMPTVNASIGTRPCAVAMRVPARKQPPPLLLLEELLLEEELLLLLLLEELEELLPLLLSTPLLLVVTLPKLPPPAICAAASLKNPVRLVLRLSSNVVNPISVKRATRLKRIKYSTTICPSCRR